MKPILRAAIVDSGKTVKAVAAEMGMPYGRLVDSLNDHEPADLRAGALVPFMRATTLGPLRDLAQQMRCAVIQLPDIGNDDDSVTADALQSIESLGESIAEIRRSLADRTMTSEEAARCERKVNAHIDIMFSLLLKLRALVPKPAPARMTLPQASASETRRRA